MFLVTIDNSPSTQDFDNETDLFHHLVKTYPSHFDILGKLSRYHQLIGCLKCIHDTHERTIIMKEINSLPFNQTFISLIIKNHIKREGLNTRDVVEELLQMYNDELGYKILMEYCTPDMLYKMFDGDIKKI